MSETADATLNVLQRDVSEVRRTLYGNGQPGLKTRVERIETQIGTAVKILWSLLILAVPSSISLIGIAITYIR